jgi:hypothetical protein
MRKFTRRDVVKATVAAVVVSPSVASGHVVEPETDIRPALPFSEEQARALMRLDVEGYPRGRL